MSVIAAALKHMLAAGMTADQIVSAVAEMESTMPAAHVAPTRSKGAERTARWRASRDEQASQTVTDRHETSQNVTGVTSVTAPFLSPPPSPKPLSTTTNLSQEPPIVPQTKGRKRAVRRSYPEAFEACWNAYPHHQGRSSKPNAADQFDRLPADEQAALPAAIAKFRPKVTEVCGGKGAPDMALWLKDGKHLSWADASTAGAMAAIPKFPNAAIRGYVVDHKSEGWAVSFLDTCAFAEADGARTITAPAAFIAGKLRADVPALEQRGIVIAVQTAAGPNRSRSAA